MPLKEIPGDYVYLRGLSPQTYWTAKCPVKHCRKVNSVEPGRSFKPFTRCVHFQQLKEPGKPSAFLFNTKARAAVCQECGYKNSDLDTMEAHKEVYCPALKKKKTAPVKREKSKRPGKEIFKCSSPGCDFHTTIRENVSRHEKHCILRKDKPAEKEKGKVYMAEVEFKSGGMGHKELVAINPIEEKITVPGADKGWQPVKTVRPLQIPESRKVKKRPPYHDPNLVQGDLFSFFPQNQADLFDFFEEDGPAQSVKVETLSSEDRPQNILILSCSQHKIERPARPIEFYNGQSYRIVRKFLKENPDLNIEIYVLSAKYGLIDAMDPDEILEPYDLKMDPEIASRWKEILERTIDKDRITRANSFFYGSSLYYSVLPFEIPHSQGKIGEQLHQLKEWLESLRKEVIA